QAQPEVFGLAQEPPPLVSPAPVQMAQPATPGAAKEPIWDAEERPTSRPAPPPPPRPSEGHASRFSIWFSPRVLPWVVVGAVLLAFLLTFFPWVGLYPG